MIRNWLNAHNNAFGTIRAVEIIEGDSQIVVPELLQRLNERCLFWLDAGYCGWGGGIGNPNRLGSEFIAILSDKITDHVILMDDADGINGEGGSPTLPELIALIEVQLSKPPRGSSPQHHQDHRALASSRRRNLEAQYRLRDAVLILRGSKLNLRLRLLQLRLAQLDDRAQAQVVAVLRQPQGQIRLINELLADADPVDMR